MRLVLRPGRPQPEALLLVMVAEGGLGTAGRGAGGAVPLRVRSLHTQPRPAGNSPCMLLEQGPGRCVECALPAAPWLEGIIRVLGAVCCEAFLGRAHLATAAPCAAHPPYITQPAHKP